MPSVLKISFNEKTNYCSLTHKFNKRFIDFLSQGIKPISCRFYDAQAKTWKVHVSKLSLVLSIGKRLFEVIDDRDLPQWVKEKVKEELQASQQKFGDYVTPIDDRFCSTPYDVLYLKESAPWVVVMAVYHALVKQHHPDCGGDPSKFIEIQKAYEKIKNERGK